MSSVLKVLIILLTGNINGQRNRRNGNRKNRRVTPYEFYGCSDFELTESQCNNACVENTRQDIKFCTRRKYCCMLNAIHNGDYANNNHGYRHLGIYLFIVSIYSYLIHTISCIHTTSFLYGNTLKHINETVC